VKIFPSPSQQPAYRLLRAFLAVNGVAVDGEPLASLPRDWITLLPTLRSQRMRPLAFWVVRKLGLSPPAEIEEELRSAFYSASLRYERLRGALLEIGHAFSARGIPAIALKGMALAGRVYPDPACRPMEDIDLLVKPEHLAAASELLVALGYADKSFGIEDFLNPESGIDVDLHAEPLNATHLPIRRKAWSPDLDAWRDRAQPLFPTDTRLRRLDPLDHFIYLCHHAWLHHGLKKPLGLLDICLAFRELDAARNGDGLSELRATRSAHRGLWYALAACNTHLGARIFQQLLREVRPDSLCLGEPTIHRVASRGWLPEFARYGYLWLALSPDERMSYLCQFVSAGRDALRAWTQGAEGCQGP
jgi:hypothetical protein